MTVTERVDEMIASMRAKKEFPFTRSQVKWLCAGWISWTLLLVATLSIK